MFSDDWSKRAAAVIGWTVLYREWKRPRLYLLAHYAEGCLSDEVSEMRLWTSSTTLKELTSRVIVCSFFSNTESRVPGKMKRRTLAVRIFLF